MLRVAAGEGRLTAEELDERLEKALTARTYGELEALGRELPAAPGRFTGPAAPKPKDVIRIYHTSGWAKQEGRWLVPRRMEVRVRSGHVKLDFTEAVITQPVLRIDPKVGSGGLKLLTKPGIVVDTDDVEVRSGRVKVSAPWGAEVPVILRIEVSGKVGSGRLKARPPRRTFGQWLLRRPRPYRVAPP